jgi:hypothetical protein
MKTCETMEVLVSIVDGKIQLTIDGAPAETIKVQNGESVSWSPADPAATLVLVFPHADKPVEEPIYFGEPGEPIEIEIAGVVNKHYRYSVVFLKDVPYTRRKRGELAIKKGDYPPKFTVDVAVKDPVVIIR